MMYHTKLPGALLACCIFLCAVPTLNAQHSGSKREVGLSFYSLNLSGTSFSAFFKKQRKENIYQRIRFFSNINSIFSKNEQALSLQIGGSIGREKRMKLDEKLDFYHGPELSLALGVESSQRGGFEDAYYLVNPRFGWVVGLMHRFNERWAMNIETTPSVSLSYTYLDHSVEGPKVGINLIASNQVSLGVVRMF